MLLTSVMTIIAVLEFSKITEGWSKHTMPLLILDIVGALALMLVIGYGVNVAIWIALILCRLIAQLYYKNIEPVKAMSLAIFKQVYLGLGLGAMLKLSCVPNQLLAVLFFIWISDTGAYLVGSLIGKNPLFKRISPKKSWEGFFGGLIFSLVAAFIFCTYLSSFFGLGNDLVLIESLIKRSLNIKDSGTLIPGHGGLLDRIDSLLIAMPAAWVIISLFKLV
jgi:phosphatidate cytidylyltransferase